MKTYILILLTLTCYTSYSQIPTSGLLAYYPFCGNTYDYSGNGHSLDWIGASSATTDRNGVANRAYYFNNGSGGSLFHRDTCFQDTTNLTYSLWMNSTNDSQYSVLLSNGYIFTSGVQIEQSGTSYATMGHNITVSFGYAYSFAKTVPITINAWHHIVLRRATGLWELFVDTISSGTFSGYMITPCCVFKIGAEDDGASIRNAFTGDIDDVAIYNRALSNAEIGALYRSSDNRVTSQPLPVTKTAGSNVFFAINAGTGLTYQWQQDTGAGFKDLADVGIYSGVTTDTLHITGVSLAMNNYQYRCAVSDPMCSSGVSQSAKLNVLPVSVNSLINNIDISVYPNPAHSKFFIESANPGMTHGYHIQIDNIIGQCIYMGSFNNARSEIILNKAGFYFIKILDENNIVVGNKKISIE